MSQPDEIKIRAHDAFRQSLSRRSFMQTGGAAAGMGVMLIGCGSSKSTTSVATTGGAPGTTGAAGTTAAGTSTSSSNSTSLR